MFYEPNITCSVQQLNTGDKVLPKYFFFFVLSGLARIFALAGEQLFLLQLLNENVSNIFLQF